MTKVFIDGSSGTTGLRIRTRLEARKDIELIILPEDKRHDDAAIKQAINSSGISFLCLPDDAARQAVEMVENPHTVILDTSTAHRTAPGWAYGFPELSAQHWESIKSSHRIAVPGCHASGFIALVTPLVSAGLVTPGTELSCFSLTGYSGGGKKMIAQYEDEGRDGLLDAPRQYALGQSHKHLKEMVKISGIGASPAFCPVVGDFYSGMEVTVPLFASQLKAGAGMEDVKNVYRALYNTEIVKYAEGDDEEGFLSAGALTGKDKMIISVHGNEERLLLTARYDNLGKGASGAAVECMNIVMGIDPATGLEL
jgi:N-acetyl-gamma-glutamyl-phosphate reductase